MITDNDLHALGFFETTTTMPISNVKFGTVFENTKDNYKCVFVRNGAGVIPYSKIVIREQLSMLEVPNQGELIEPGKQIDDLDELKNYLATI